MLDTSKEFGTFWVIKRTFMLFVPAALVILLFLWYIANLEIKTRREERAFREFEVLEVEKEIRLEFIKQIREDLVFLTSFPGIISSLEEGGTFPEGIGKVFQAFAEAHKSYDQLRVLDSRGMERLRVNFSNGKGEIVPVEGLQNKGSRYYVREGLSLDPGEVYISPMDLNIEQGKVEVPFKPMMRFVMPIYSSDEELLGLGVLNYLGGIFLRKCQTFEGRDQTVGEVGMTILDQDGYWLLAASPEMEWGFMLPERKNQSFAYLYPKVWQELQKVSRGHLEMGEDLLFFRSLSATYGKEESLSRKWYLLSSVPRSQLFSGEEVFLWLFLILAFLALLWGILFFGVSRFLLEKKEATVDNLTGIYNRRCILTILRNESEKGSEKTSCVALLDMGNFKKVNDTCGHEAGDEVLRRSAKAMCDVLRPSDALGRYGGDEFLIYLHHVNIAEGEAIMRRLAEKIEHLSIPSCSQVSLAADYGIVEVPRERPSFIAAVSLADERMYENKKNRKAGQKNAFREEEKLS